MHSVFEAKLSGLSARFSFYALLLLFVCFAFLLVVLLMFDVQLFSLFLVPLFVSRGSAACFPFFGVCVLSSWFAALLGFYYLVLFASVG